jgi:hypothetical protein
MDSARNAWYQADDRKPDTKELHRVESTSELLLVSKGCEQRYVGIFRWGCLGYVLAAVQTVRHCTAVLTGNVAGKGHPV